VGTTTSYQEAEFRPGSIVVSVNSARPTLPQVLVYDPEVPKSEAAILHLEDKTRTRSSARPAAPTRSGGVFDYLSPRRRVTYFYDEAKTGKPGASPV
jgi:hypothetical protein